MHNTPEKNPRPVIVTAYTCEHVKTGERWTVAITPLDARLVGADTFTGGLGLDEARELCAQLTRASKNHDGAYIYTVNT